MIATTAANATMTNATNEAAVATLAVVVNAANGGGD